MGKTKICAVLFGVRWEAAKTLLREAGRMSPVIVARLSVKF